jgi:hypothetical protein
MALTKREQVENEALIEVLFERIKERIIRLKQENEELIVCIKRLEVLTDGDK